MVYCQVYSVGVGRHPFPLSSFGIHDDGASTVTITLASKVMTNASASYHYFLKTEWNIPVLLQHLHGCLRRHTFLAEELHFTHT
jgi:hypothetical protein